MPGWNDEQLKAIQDKQDAAKSVPTPTVPKAASPKVKVAANPGVGPGITNPRRLDNLGGPYPEDMPDSKVDRGPGSRNPSGVESAPDDGVPEMLRRVEETPAEKAAGGPLNKTVEPSIPLADQLILDSVPVMTSSELSMAKKGWEKEMDRRYKEAETVAARNAAALSFANQLEDKQIPWQYMATAIDNAVKEGLSTGYFNPVNPGMVPLTPETDRGQGDTTQLIPVSSLYKSEGFQPVTPNSGMVPTPRAATGEDRATQVANARAAIVNRVLADFAVKYNTTPYALEMEANLRGIPWAEAVEKAKRGGMWDGDAVASETLKNSATIRGVDLGTTKRLPVPSGLDIDDKAFSPNFSLSTEAGVFYDPDEDEQIARPGEKGHDVAMALLERLEADGIDAGWLSTIRKQADPFQAYLDKRIPDLMSETAPGELAGSKSYDAAQRRAWARAVSEVAALKTAGLWTAPIFLRGLDQRQFKALGLGDIDEALLPDVEVVGFGNNSDLNHPNLVLRQRSTAATVFDAMDLPLYAGTALVENIQENAEKKENPYESDVANFLFAPTREGETLTNPWDAVKAGISNRRDPLTALLESDFALPRQSYDSAGNLLRDKDGLPLTTENWRPAVAATLGLALSVISPDTLVGAGLVRKGLSGSIKLADAAIETRNLSRAYRNLDALAEARTAGGQLYRSAMAAEDVGNLTEAKRLRDLANTEFKRASDIEGLAFSESRPLMRNLDIADTEIARGLEATTPSIADKHLLADLDVPDASGQGALSNALLNVHPGERQALLRAEHGRIAQQNASRIDLFSTEAQLERVEDAFRRIWFDPVIAARVQNARLYREAAPFVANLEAFAKGDPPTLDALKAAREKLRSGDVTGFLRDVSAARSLPPHMNPALATSPADAAARTQLRHQFALNVAAAAQHYRTGLSSPAAYLKDLKRAAQDAILVNNESRAAAAGVLLDGLERKVNPNLGVRSTTDPTLALQNRLRNVAPRLSEPARKLLEEAKAAGGDEAALRPVVAIYDTRARVNAYRNGTTVAEEWKKLTGLEEDLTGAKLAAAQGRGAEVLYDIDSHTRTLKAELAQTRKQLKAARKRLNELDGSDFIDREFSYRFDAKQREKFKVMLRDAFARDNDDFVNRINDPDVRDGLGDFFGATDDAARAEIEELTSEVKRLAEREAALKNSLLNVSIPGLIAEDPTFLALGRTPKVTEVADWVRNTGSDAEKLILERILPDLPAVVFEIDHLNMPGFSGKYSPSIHRIKINLGAATRKTVLHEMLHAATSHRIDVAPNSPEVQRLRQLWETASARAVEQGKTHYGLKNLDEFIAEAFSNPRFQAWLKETPSTPEVKSPSLWSRFTTALTELFGRTKDATPTMLDEVTQAIDDLLQIDQPDFLMDPSRRSFDFDSPEMYSPDTGELITDSPAFKRWFGNSKVVGEDGKPLVVYHGTRNGEFEEFLPGKANPKMQLGFGIHFADNEKLAQGYADGTYAHQRGKSPRVVPVYLRIEKPLLADRIVVEGTPEFALAEKLAGKKSPGIFNRNLEGLRVVYLQNALDIASPQAAEREIRSLGYDGVRYEAVITNNYMRSPGAGRESRHPSWLVFDPTSIKSVFNRGTFDPSDPRIFYAGIDRTDGRMLYSKAESAPKKPTTPKPAPDLVALRASIPDLNDKIVSLDADITRIEKRLAKLDPADAKRAKTAAELDKAVAAKRGYLAERARIQGVIRRAERGPVEGKAASTTAAPAPATPPPAPPPPPPPDIGKLRLALAEATSKFHEAQAKVNAIELDLAELRKGGLKRNQEAFNAKGLELQAAMKEKRAATAFAAEARLRLKQAVEADEARIAAEAKIASDTQDAATVALSHEEKTHLAAEAKLKATPAVAPDEAGTVAMPADEAERLRQMAQLNADVNPTVRVTPPSSTSSTPTLAPPSTHPLYDDAVKYVRGERQASASMLQRRFGIGYNQAAQIIDDMERAGVVGPSDASKPRQVLLPPIPPVAAPQIGAVTTATPIPPHLPPIAVVTPTATVPIPKRAGAVPPVSPPVVPPSAPSAAASGSARTTSTLPLVLEQGRIVLDALAAPDPNSLIHALGHVIRQGLDRDEVYGLNAWLKSASSPALLDARTGKWVAATAGATLSPADIQNAEDAFTDALRGYINNGVAPPGTSPALDDIKQQLAGVLAASPTPLPPETQRLYDRILGFTPDPAAQAEARKAARDPRAFQLGLLRRLVSGPPVQAGPEVYSELSKAAQSLGISVDSKALQTAIEKTGKIEFPTPVLGRIEYTADDLATMQLRLEEEWRASRDELVQRLPITGSHQAQRETWLTDKIESALKTGESDSRSMKVAKAAGRFVAATVIGMDATDDLRKFPEAVRSKFLVAQRKVETAYADAVKLVAERDPKKFRDYLLGVNVGTKHERQLSSAGISKVGPVRDTLSSYIDTLSDEARNGLDILSRNPAVDALSPEDKDDVAAAVSALLYNNKSPAFNKQLVQVLGLPDITPGSGVINSLPQTAPFAGALYRLAKSPDAGSGLDAFIDGARQLAGEEGAARAQVLLAGHGAAGEMRSVWRELGLAVSREDALLFKNWVNGEKIPENKLDDIRRIARRIGMDADFVEATGLADAREFVPSEAMGRLQKALMKKTPDRIHWLMSPEDLRDTAASSAGKVAGGLISALKVSRTRGIWALRKWKVFADSVDHVYQMGQVAGLGTALATSARVLPQTLIALFPGIPRILYHGESAGVIKPGSLERLKDMFQAGGDRAAHVVSKVMTRGALRFEVNSVLKGGTKPVTFGGKVYRSSDLRRIAEEEGIFSSFPREQDTVFRKAATDAASTWQKLGAAPHELESYVEDMAEGWAERERLGAMLTLMETGLDPRTAAKVAVNALFDYGGSVHNAERSILMSIFFPFWSFEKNARRMQVNALTSTSLLSRMNAIRRFQEYTPEAITQALYLSQVDPYGLDVSQLPPEARENYYAMRAEIESHFGRDPKTGLVDYTRVPKEVRDVMRSIFRNLGGYEIRNGDLYQTSKEVRDLTRAANMDARRETTSGQKAHLGTEEAAVPRPDPSARATFRRDIGGVAFTPRFTKELNDYYRLMRQQYGEVPYLELYAPETTIETGVRGAASTLATYYMAGHLVKDMLSKHILGEPDDDTPLKSWETSDVSRLYQPLRQVLDTDRAFLLPEVTDLLTDSHAAAPTRISKQAYDVLRASGFAPIAVKGLVDPFATATGMPEETAQSSLTPGRTTSEFQAHPERIADERYYIAPGPASILWQMIAKPLDEALFLKPAPFLPGSESAQSGLEKAMDIPDTMDTADLSEYLQWLLSAPIDETNRGQTARREDTRFTKETTTPTAP